MNKPHGERQKKTLPGMVFGKLEGSCIFMAFNPVDFIYF